MRGDHPNLPVFPSSFSFSSQELAATSSLQSVVVTETVVEGVVERITFENAQSSFRVIKLAVAGRADRLAVVGMFPSTPLGARIRVRGQIEVDRKHGEQLRVESLIELLPDTLVGLEKYLASGIIKGVGPKLAQRIVGAFGLDSLRVLDDEPERLRSVEGLGDKRRAALASAWRQQRATRDVMVFLQSHGASLALAMRIVRRYGSSAMNVVARDPYRLAFDVHGVGFKTADRIASSVGFAPGSPERMRAGVLQVLHDVSEAGHVWTAHDEVTARAAQMLGLQADEDEVQKCLAGAVNALVLAGRAVVEPIEAERAVFAAEMHAAEVRLARRLAEIARARPRPLDGVAAAVRAFEAQTRMELAPEQKQAVEQAACQQVLVVTGGPGVGKTTIVRAILAVLARAHVEVRLAAPTGRAAKRMSEATGAEATTLHRLLDFEPKTATFKRDRNRPIDAGAVVVDEASMLDLPTADALAQAIAPGTRLLLVGDVDQLPSVGAGAVLRDVIASGAVPCTRLRRIFRQAARSLIVVNAHRINDGEPPIAAPAGSDADFFIVERRDPERARATVLELVTSRIPDRFGLDPMRDIQVLTPMNRGAAGAIALNDALQAALNPPRADSAASDAGVGRALVRGAHVYRVGDKVMQLRNDYEKNVFNGDVGLVASIDPEENAMTVRFDEREVAFDASELEYLVLAYACTVHKSQGSEYPAVVVPLLTTHFVMLSKNLLYTAVTRGKRLVVLVCDPRAVEIALSDRRKSDRRTRLATRLAERLA
jgi:exodeoxyribonuclease V alpha subunit